MRIQHPIRDPQPNWLWFAVLCVAAFMLVMCTCDSRGSTPGSEPSTKRPVLGQKWASSPDSTADPRVDEAVLLRVYKPDGDWCARCKVVEQALISYGVKIVRVCEIRKAPAYFPQCVYKGGKPDSGDRILRGQCRFADKVQLITVIEPKEKK